MDKKEFSTMEICKGLKIPHQRFRVWIDEGYIVPDIAKATGQGSKNIFSLRAVYSIGVFKHLIEVSRLPRKEGGKFVKCWQEKMTELHKGDPYAVNFLPLYNIFVFARSGKKVIFAAYYSLLGDKEFMGSSNWNHTFYTSILQKAQKEMFDNKDLDDLLFINFLKIKESVDKALA